MTRFEKNWALRVADAYEYAGADCDYDIAEVSLAQELLGSQKLALCANRHDMPAEVNCAVFGQKVDPLDTIELESIAETALRYCFHLDLYVTGLTQALIAVVNVCIRNSIDLTLWHYNRDIAEYYPQPVNTLRR